MINAYQERFISIQSITILFDDDNPGYIYQMTHSKSTNCGKAASSLIRYYRLQETFPEKTSDNPK